MSKEDKINKYINEHYEWMLNEVKTKIAKDKMGDYSDDLLHTVILDLYNLKESKIDQMIRDGKLSWYVLVGCGMQLRSSSSPFYRLFRKEKMQARENYSHNHPDASSGRGILEQIYEPYEMEDWEVCFREMWDNELGFYQRTLLQRKFMDKWTYDQIHKHYQISKRHLIKDINEAILTIREKCNCNE